MLVGRTEPANCRSGHIHSSRKSGFLDSAITRKFHYGRSKTTTVIKEMVGNTNNSLAERMRARPFTLSTNGNDDGGNKQFPLVVRTVIPTILEVRSDVLSMHVCRGSATGDAIFKVILEEFAKYRVPRETCNAVGCDNAYIMTGKEKGVFAFCKKRHNNSALVGCTLHLVHISAEKGPVACQCLRPLSWSTCFSTSERAPSEALLW